MDYKGIICAMITPLDENQNINEKATRELIDYLIDTDKKAYPMVAPGAPIDQIITE